MADTKTNAPASERPEHPERPLPNAAVEHRLNRLSLGHLGRIAYSPVDSDDWQVGKLQTNRTIDSSQHFKLLSPFAVICPSTMTTVPETGPSKKKLSHVAVAQETWLLKNHPEAEAGGEVDARTLAEELRNLKSAAPDSDGATSSSLLAVGEISDHTDVHLGTVGRPALAMAAGESGHILRIVPVDYEEAGWPDKSLSAGLPKVSSSAHGEWIEDGVPISNIKFAVDSRRYDPIRWLLVQKPSGTTVFEPTIRLLPFQGNLPEHERNRLHSKAPSHIYANPLFKINFGKTGGSAHTDVSFNPAVDGRFPQLAIIDKAGHWSIWDITGSRSARPRNLQPISMVRGSISSGPVPSLRCMTGKDPATHQLLWVVPRGRDRYSRHDEEEGPEGQRWGLYSKSPVRSKHLLVCTDSDIRLYDAVHGTQLAGIRVVNINRAESIIDVQPCPRAPSQVYILTTSSLYWVDVGVAKDGQARLSVIVSCEHHRKADSGALKLSVCPISKSSQSRSCVAFVVSAGDKRSDMFVFMEPSTEEVAHVRHQAIMLDLPSALRSVFAASLPVQRFNRSRERCDGGAEGVLGPDTCQIFQVFGLQSNLSLGTSLFVLSTLPVHNLDAPRLVNETKPLDTRRKRFLKHIENAFVVPERYEERSAVSRSHAEGEGPPSGSDRKPGKKKHSFISLEAVCERLDELISSEIGPAKLSRQFLAGVIHSRAMDLLGDGDHMRVRTLAELVSDRLSACNHDTLEEEWTTFREEIKQAYEGKVQVAELACDNMPGDLGSLMRQLSQLSYDTDDSPEAYKESQRHLLRHIGGKQYLSLFGISVVSPILAANAEAEAGVSHNPPSQAPGDEPLLRSSPAPCATQSHRSQQDEMDIDVHSVPDPGPLARLRQYVDIPATPTTDNLSRPSTTRLLSHWPREPADPWSYEWEDDWVTLTAEDEEAMARRKKRDEARRKRLEKRRRLAAIGDEDDAVGGPTTQPVSDPRLVHSSQPRSGEEGSQSQSQSQSQRPRISMSQVVPGPHGGRPLAGKKKKVKSGFR